MLGRFYLTNGEVWVNETVRWTVCDGPVDDADGPEPIYAIIEGTSSQSPLIEWWLSIDSLCFIGTRYTVGTRTPTIGSNTPYLIGPNGYDFTGVPADEYFLCAEIDADDSIPETDDLDNDIRSEAKVTVQDCP